MALVKICGVVRVEDAVACVDAGASAIGVNLIGASKRAVSKERAKEIAAAVGGRAEIILVVADMRAAELVRLREETGIAWLQLHGDEAPDLVRSFLPHTFKAVRIGGEEDVRSAAAFPGEHLLVDSKSDSAALGGTGKTFDWHLVRALAGARKLTLAGGLTPENVGEAIRAVRPYRVDVASGVERAGKPREKDLVRVRAFIEATRNALA
jgi:phosphoribosylanthranilate isomerase